MPKIKYPPLSSSSTAQLSPRILSAYERLDSALSRLKNAVDGSKHMVPACVVDDLQNQIETLNAQNNSLINDLDQISSDDLEGKCSSLADENERLRQKLEHAETRSQNLLKTNSDISGRVEKLIGTVQQVLEEE